MGKPVVLPLDKEYAPIFIEYGRGDSTACGTTGKAELCLMRNDEAVARHGVPLSTGIRGQEAGSQVERFLKSLLWIYGGNRVLVDAPGEIVAALQSHYADTECGRFDADMMGGRIYDAPFRLEACPAKEMPEPSQRVGGTGCSFDGCRIGFDLGGSDRKCAAVIDGEVVFSEEVAWDPYFQADPQYHFDGIMDSLRRAASHLPRVDAIGGSAAGVYVDNEVRVASLFRGVPPDVFEKSVRRMFFRIQKEWGGVPFKVVNDGEVTALAGAASLGAGGVLGISMGTSMAAGYVTPEGVLTGNLNELAFVPVDMRTHAPVDEWSGDRGCGVQYFSQQGVARLARAAGIDFPDDMPFADRLTEVQSLMKEGDERAARIYETIGGYLGETIPFYLCFYDFFHLLLLGRVTSGEGGELLIDAARTVLQSCHPEIAERIRITMPDEKMKRHGQAVIAASLPDLQAL